ncbi:uncharacterized protein LOC106153018 isoform X2 [Lingula anatina]|uniref:Uncharacterized protein LOC106153018 isoform X2 n=1 Tax=Lingula anatina TaxID=7574 RepID=A0A2R2MLU4_LINAN|nr:uncharacterized protein LOC106153018 isoform X2 [Lingula anatina]|eukprot:XP_023931175.1 uncharacterized protein LOC106153018 isoform X2 [Lingula anatina]
MAGKHVLLVALQVVLFSDCVNSQAVPLPGQRLPITNGFLLTQTNAFGPRVANGVPVGRPIPGINDERECLAACIQDGTCAAVDFFRATTTCIIQSSTTICVPPSVGTAVTVYTKFPCGFDVVSRNAHVPGGTMQPNFSGTALQCLQLCLSNPQCRAADYNQDGSCWLHGEDTACNALVKKPNCDHYVRVGACIVADTPPRDFASVSRNTAIQGGVLQRGLHEPRQCLLYCQVNDNCRAYDFNFRDRTCFHHDQNTVCNTRMSVQQVIHVTKCTSCAGGQCMLLQTPTPSTAPTTSNTVAPTAGAVTNPPFIIASGSGMSVTQGVHIIGGILQPTIRNFTMCATTCLSFSVESCPGFDFNAAQRACFFHTNTTICNDLVAKPSCTNYRRVPCGSGSGGTGQGFTQNVHIIGGVLQPLLRDLASCMAMCSQLSLESCGGFDYSSDQRACFFHTNRTICNNLVPKPNCVNFRRQSCSADTMTTMTTMPTTETPNTAVSMPTPPSFPNGIIQASNGYHINGGVLIQGISDAATCAARCVALPLSLCQAIDFNSRTSRCYFHSPRTACNTLLAKAHCVNYRRVRCTGSYQAPHQPTYSHRVHHAPAKPVHHAPAKPVYHPVVIHLPVQKTYDEKQTPSVAPPHQTYHQSVPAVQQAPQPQPQPQPQVPAPAPAQSVQTAGSCPRCQTVGQFSPGPNQNQFCVCGAGLLSNLMTCASGTEWCQRVVTCVHAGSCGGA